MAMPAASAFAARQIGHGADERWFEPLRTKHTRPFQSLLPGPQYHLLFFSGAGRPPTANLLVQGNKPSGWKWRPTVALPATPEG